MRIRTCALLLAALLFSHEFARADDDGPPVDVFPSSSPSSAPTSTPKPPSFPRPGTPGMAPSTVRPSSSSSPTAPPPAPSKPQSPVPQRPLSTNAPAPVRLPQAATPASAATPSNAPSSAVPSTTFSTLDLSFVDVMTSLKSTPQAKVEALRQKLAKVALPDRQRDIFNNSPSGPLVVHEVKTAKIEKPAEPVIDLFLQAVHSLHIEVISAQENMAVVNGRDLYLGDTLIMQTGAFTTQARVKEIKPTTIVFENPVDHHVTSLIIPQESDNLEESTGSKPQSLEDIEGISLQERH